MLEMRKNGEDAFRALMETNAKTIGELQERIHRLHGLLVSHWTYEGRVAWSAACDEFFARYDSLSFPGGFG